MVLRDELAKVLEQRAGLDAPTAERAAEVAMDFLKQRAPEPVRRYLEEGGLAKGLGGIFGVWPSTLSS